MKKIIIYLFFTVVVVIAIVLFFNKFFRLTIPEVNSFTVEEKTFLDTATKNLDCTITVDKNYGTAIDHKGHGNFYLIFDCRNSPENLCLKDSAIILTYLTPIAIGFEKVMNNRNLYDTLTLSVINVDRSVSKMEFEKCEINISFLLNHMPSHIYKELIKNY